MECISTFILWVSIGVVHRSEWTLLARSKLDLISCDSPFEKLQNGIKLSKKKRGDPIVILKILQTSRDLVVFSMVFDLLRSKKSAFEAKRIRYS